ncbi:MAG TPA: hypothetical protein VFJ18_08715 [Pararhizobium sp.]|nr:hypothetical protein [Pararhizobium sp.]
MAKAVVSSFVFAVVAILAASFFAPRSNAGVEGACSQAYGVNPCVASTTTPVSKAF